MARRFIVKKQDIREINENLFEIYGDEVNHINVLRYEVGDNITVNEFVCCIENINKKSIGLKIIKHSDKKGEPSVDITLYQAMLKSDKMDFLIQKVIEIGIKSITPFFSKNVVVKLDEKDRVKRKDKFQKISYEACKQCGRTDEVIVNSFGYFNDILKELKIYDCVFFAYELEDVSLKEKVEEIKNKSKNAGKIAIIVGAEGGFDPTEAKKISEINNVISVGLGERILRAETAAIYLTSIVMYEFDN
ncbi:MAG: 16S rRNA (uracil(1498)-N(3))-methyltransferase [Clostridia bacterium]|nr:16S rRNA (uracil(1498)-N(3))-methyltransferase [Clostridia bacterium]